jgi:hypothetical protein
MPTVAQVSAVIRDIGPRFVADAVTRNAEMFNLVPKVDPSDPKGPRWMVKTAGNSAAGKYTPGTLAAAGAATFAQASMNWGNYSCPVKFNVRSLVELGLAGDQVLVNQILEQLKDGSQALIASMNSDCISGSDTSDGIIGVSVAIDDTGTYAGIDRGSVTEFACYVAANGGSGRTLTVAIMDTAYDYFVNTIKKEPGRWALLTGSAQASTMRGFSTGAVSSGANAATMLGFVEGGVPKILSYSNLQYRDMPIIVVPGYATGRVDFVNLDALEMECLNGGETPFFLGLPGEPEYEKSGDEYLWVVYCWCQLRIRNPKHNAFSIQDLN